MTLPLISTRSTELPTWRQRVAETINNLIPKQGTWTAVIRGSGTAGTYEITSQSCSYFRIGNRVWLDLSITLAGAITGGGTGNLQITGVPFPKRDSHAPRGQVASDGFDYTDGAHLTLAFDTASVLVIHQTNDNAAATLAPISGAAAGDGFAGSISYEIAG